MSAIIISCAMRTRSPGPVMRGQLSFIPKETFVVDNTVTIKLTNGTRVSVTHNRLFIEVDVTNDWRYDYPSKREMDTYRIALAGRNKTCVRIGIAGESRRLIQIEDASVGYVVHPSGEKFVRVSRGTITGGSLPMCFGLEFDEIVFCKSHEESTP